jgi:hypothetical protein
MNKTRVPMRAPIVMFFLGVVAGAVAGWVAHRAVVSPGSEPSVSGASVSGASSLAPHARIQAANAASRPATPASGATIPPSVTDAASLVVKGTSRTKASTGDASEASTASGQGPSIDDLRDSVSIQCTFGPGDGGWWPNGKLTVADAAWQGGPVDFQSIDYEAGTAQMVGQVTRSPTGDVPATVTTSDSDVTFTGRAANGTLTVISVFAMLDNAGHHIGVMSLHDGKHQLDIAQFYGGCESAQKRLN